MFAKFTPWLHRVLISCLFWKCYNLRLELILSDKMFSRVCYKTCSSLSIKGESLTKTVTNFKLRQFGVLVITQCQSLRQIKWLWSVTRSTGFLSQEFLEQKTEYEMWESQLSLLHLRRIALWILSCGLNKMQTLVWRVLFQNFSWLHRLW